MSSITLKYPVNIKISISGCLIYIKKSVLKNAFITFKTEYIWISIDDNGDLFGFETEPMIDQETKKWCNSKNSQNTQPIFIDSFKLENVEWQNTLTKISKNNL